jgi:D-alanyl-D-alanine carboxypeptidase
VNRRVGHATTRGGHQSNHRPLRTRSSFWWTLFAISTVALFAIAATVITFIAPSRSPFALLFPAGSTQTPSSTPTPTKSQLPGGFEPGKYSIDDPMSVWLVVDKLRPLNPKSWVPTDLVKMDLPRAFAAEMRQPAALKVEQMFADFKAENPGRGLKVQSAYRSYATQKAVWDGNYTLTALPGYSEHQTGMAIDIGATSGKCAVQTCFADQPEGKWLAENAWKYGFVLRYPPGKEGITGYQYEPWHFRFVDDSLATYMHVTGIQTLEEVFNLPAAPKYANQK